MKTRVLEGLGLHKLLRRIYDYSQRMRNDFSEEHLRKYRLPDAKCRNRWLRFRLARTDWPLPPSELVFAVAGTPNLSWFLHSGGRGGRCIHDTLHKNNVELESLGKVLDFGCGSGRVIRHLGFLENAELFGADYNPEMVDWCRANLPFASFTLNDLEPPLPYPSGMFDLVYAFSVFTHLQEQRQLLWMQEFRRILKSDALLLLSLSGLSYLHLLTPEEQGKLRGGELVVRDSGLEGSNDCAAFHPKKYVQTKLAKGFTIVDFVPEGATGNPWQDLYLLKGRS